MARDVGGLHRGTGEGERTVANPRRHQL
jgi:hypothetical protein